MQTATEIIEAINSKKDDQRSEKWRNCDNHSENIEQANRLRQTIAQVFVIFEAIYGERWSRQIDDQEIIDIKIQQYAEVVKGYTPKILQQAIALVRDECKHPPTPAELKEKLDLARMRENGGAYNAGCGLIEPRDKKPKKKETESERKARLETANKHIEKMRKHLKAEPYQRG